MGRTRSSSPPSRTRASGGKATGPKTPVLWTTSKPKSQGRQPPKRRAASASQGRRRRRTSSVSSSASSTSSAGGAAHGKHRYRICLKRRGATSKTCYTYAYSKEQAKRFCHIRNPGYRVTKVVRDDPAS